MKESHFQFKGFKINRSLIERNDNEVSKKVSLGFKPEGTIDKEKGIFLLVLGVKIKDATNSFNIEIEAVAEYNFKEDVSIEILNNFFYINAPALLFPYIRAYISTLTNLSGFEPINLPTLDMTKLGEELRQKTVEI